MENKLKKARGVLGISQLELSKRVGITRVAISNIERGVTCPNGKVLIKICKEVKKPVEEVFYLSKEEKKCQK